MKKILSLLSTVSLSTIISTNFIACNITDTNNKNNEHNKPTEPQFIPQQPPKNSNWKLVTDMSKEKGVIINKNVFEDVIVQNGKHYFVIFRLKGNEIPWKIYKLEIGKPNSMPIYSDDLKDIKAFYRWDGASEPTTPIINTSTGEITNWNEKIES